MAVTRNCLKREKNFCDNIDNVPFKISRINLNDMKTSYKKEMMASTGGRSQRQQRNGSNNPCLNNHRNQKKAGRNKLTDSGVAVQSESHSNDEENIKFSYNQKLSDMSEQNTVSGKRPNNMDIKCEKNENVSSHSKNVIDKNIVGNRMKSDDSDSVIYCGSYKQADLELEEASRIRTNGELDIFFY